MHDGALHQSESIHSDEGLNFEILVFESFYGGYFTLLTLWLMIYFSVSLSPICSTQFLLQLNPLSVIRSVCFVIAITLHRMKRIPRTQCLRQVITIHVFRVTDIGTVNRKLFLFIFPGKTGSKFLSRVTGFGGVIWADDIIA